MMKKIILTAFIFLELFSATSPAYAITLDGADDYVSVPDSTTLRPAVVTMSCWFRKDTFTGGNSGTILSKNRVGPVWSSPFTSWMIRVNSATSIEFGVSAAGYTGTSVTVPTMSTSTWYHVAMSHSAAAKKAYFNGVRVSSTASSGTIGYSTLPLTFGGDTSASPIGDDLNGSLTDCRIYNRELTETEVWAVYNGGYCSTVGLILYMPFWTNEGGYQPNFAPFGQFGTSTGNVSVGVAPPRGNICD